LSFDIRSKAESRMPLPHLDRGRSVVVDATISHQRNLPVAVEGRPNQEMNNRILENVRGPR